jgi:ribose 5-phosphate isomerase A
MADEKTAAAEKALAFVKPGMRVGLGTGSTAEIFIGLLGRKNKKEKLDLACIATSEASEKQAKKLGLKLATFAELKGIDAAFDGADQVDSEKNLIKGLGGAFVREKIVDYRAEKFIVMVGENKMVESLCGIVPVEVIPLAEEAVRRELLALGAKAAPTRMEDGKKFVSDNGNFILHAEFGPLSDPKRMEERINWIPGVVDNGIFTSQNVTVVVGRKDGSAQTIEW